MGSGRIAVLLIATFLPTGPIFAGGEELQRGFDPKRDTFAFANETVVEYGGAGGAGETAAGLEEKYSRRCFVMTRAAIQFYQHARFDPSAEAIEAEELRKRIRKILRRPVWLGDMPENSRVEIPGFSGLKDFSKQHGALLREEMGQGLPTYFRPANTRVAFPVLPALQALASRQLCERLERGDLPAVMITRFHKLNHALVVTACRRMDDGQVAFSVYDPNLPGGAPPLIFDPQKSQFTFGPTFYWEGGPVRLLRIYHSPLH